MGLVYKRYISGAIEYSSIHVLSLTTAHSAIEK